MVRPDFKKWNQTTEDIRRLSIEAEHPRSRERFPALYMIGSEQDNASHWAKSINYQATGGAKPKKKDHRHGQTRQTE